MLDKKEKYTYEELKGIIERAHQQALEKSQKDWDEMLEKQGKKNSMASMAHMIQNMLISHEIEEILFGKEETK